MLRISGFATLFLTLPAWGAGLQQGERDFALSHLHATRKMFLDAVAGLTDAQWKFKPSPERWSIAEVGEHLVLAEDLLMGMLKQGLQKPPNAPGRTGSREQDERLYAQWTDRSQKAQAPQPLVPTGKWPTPEAVAREFAARREATLEFVRTTQEDLRGRTMKEGGPESDLYNLLLGIAAHVERHAAQIQEIKAHPNYPK